MFPRLVVGHSVDCSRDFGRVSRYLPGEFAQQYIDFVVLCLFHFNLDAINYRTYLSGYLAVKSYLNHRASILVALLRSHVTPSLLRSVSRSASRFCATSSNERSVSVFVQPRSLIKISPTCCRRSWWIRVSLRLAVASCTPSTAPASRKRRLSK